MMKQKEISEVIPHKTLEIIYYQESYNRYGFHGRNITSRKIVIDKIRL